jgi:formyltetrahydrofolate deformylase
VAIFVSRQEHVLLDLLWRTRSGELPMTVPQVIGGGHPGRAVNTVAFSR